MNEIKLIEPTIEYAEDIWKFRQEIIDSSDHDKFAGCGTLEQSNSAIEWIETTRVRSSVETCPSGKVPSNVYIAVRLSDNRIVGIIDLRHHIDHPILSTWGGHIGYYVRPTERGKGYGKEMLRQNLLNAQKRGIEKVLVTCNDDNVASEKTILANGGVFESTITVDDEVMKRYWITVDRELLRKELKCKIYPLGTLETYKYKGDFQRRINSPIITTANELVKDEIGEFSKKLSIEELYNYIIDVDTSTTQILKTLAFSDIKEKVTDEKRESLKKLNVVSEDENASWLIDYWCGKDVKGLIQMPFSRHWIMHVEACIKIKDKLLFAK